MSTNSTLKDQNKFCTLYREKISSWLKQKVINLPKYWKRILLIFPSLSVSQKAIHQHITKRLFCLWGDAIQTLLITEKFIKLYNRDKGKSAPPTSNKRNEITKPYDGWCTVLNNKISEPYEYKMKRSASWKGKNTL